MGGTACKHAGAGKEAGRRTSTGIGSRRAQWRQAELTFSHLAEMPLPLVWQCRLPDWLLPQDVSCLWHKIGAYEWSS